MLLESETQTQGRFDFNNGGKMNTQIVKINK